MRQATIPGHQRRRVEHLVAMELRLRLRELLLIGLAEEESAAAELAAASTEAAGMIAGTAAADTDHED